MNPLTIEWVEKAEGDFATAQRELRARSSPNYDASCFHSQQGAEKYLKAFLQENGQVVPRVHNLIDLLGLCLKIDESIQTLRPDLIVLNGYSVRIRYPGFTANKDDARRTLKSSLIVRNLIRSKLGFS